MSDQDDPIPLAPLEGVASLPRLPGQVVVETDVHALFEALGARLVATAMDAVARWGDFHLALSGGSTPFPFYLSLMTDPRYRAMPWSRTHLWIVDERRVAFDDAKSNWRQISEIFVGHAGIPDSQIHPMMATAADAAAQYEGALRAALATRPALEQRLDFVLLGMGDNGHTASLFPETQVLDERERWVADCDGPTVTPPPRVTMTYPLINAARVVAVLVAGKGKADMIHRVATGRDDFHAIPIKGIKPTRGELVWYLDAAAG
ncbi:MAG: 6-phosphogluconolactonase [Phycisphaerales bacterium]|nr:6-phosphogluconolactonase [Phycisphaerales bacterium]